MKIDGNIIAHRGVYNNEDIPENSLKAFKKAIDFHYPIELDVQLTKDNILVVFHDFDLMRMTKRKDIIQNMKYTDLKEICLLETKETIPTFQEALKVINKKVLLDIEIKNTKRIKETCNLLMQELNQYENFIVKSFNPRIVKYMKKHCSKWEVGLLMTNNTNNKFYDKLLTSRLVLWYCKPNFIAIDKNLLKNKRFMKLAQTIPTLVWSINTKEEIIDNRLIYICNNLPFDAKEKP